MIPKVAVRKFLNRERDDFRDWKSYKFSKLSRMKDDLPVDPPIWKKLKKHQRVCLLLGARLKKFAFFLDTGCGKTLLSISLVRYFRKAEKKRRFLVLVPNIVNMYEWEDEIKKHAPKTKYKILDGSSVKKWEMLEEGDSLIVVTTIIGLLHMVCEEYVDKKGKTHLKIVDKLITKISRCIDGIVLDESTVVGRHNSLPTRICRRIAKKVDIAFLLTGTPFGKDPTSLWSQMKIVDDGYALGETLALFRAAFFSESINYFSGFPEYTFKKGERKVVRQFIAHRSIRYKADAADLPQRVPIIKEVPLSKDAENHYLKLEEEFEAAIRGKHGVKDVQVIRNHFIRMRQISSGFIGYVDDDKGVRAEFEFDDNPKLDLVLSMVQEITPSYKMIVFCEYVFSGSMICRELQKLKIRYERVYGGTKDSEKVLRTFKDDEDCRVLVLQNSCTFGLNLQVARWGIFYESPTSPLTRTQAERRYVRQGSGHSKVFVGDLLVKGTRDKHNLEMLAEGKDLLAEIMGDK